jgi:photosystem II stability/assembly factor-like uncharacterized protein
MSPRSAVLVALLLAGLAGWTAAANGDAVAAPTDLTIIAADHTDAAPRAGMLDATRAGRRIVAVGDHGIVLLSDDDGATFRQAMSVPVSSTLTGVSFVDDHHGWAVGHWGVVLATVDGGESWSLQRQDLAEDRPLFSVLFRSADDGIAVGLWSLLLRTTDGGRHWQSVTLPPPPDGGKADRNLFHIFAGAGASLFLAAERGTVLRSDDGGATWRYLSTGYAGSLWTGLSLPDGTLLVGGLRGRLFRSEDGGATWQPLAVATKSSITGLAAAAGNAVLAVGLDGLEATSGDGGKSFQTRMRDDRATLTAAVATGSGWLLFSDQGVLGTSPSPTPVAGR